MQKRDPILRAFGQNVARHRQARALSQEALAEKAELDRTYLSDIERGVRNPPSGTTPFRGNLTSSAKRHKKSQMGIRSLFAISR
jgi:DNA-binding XRE family transcriptional regulator